MDKVKQWVALSLVAVLAVLAAGWFLLVAPERAEATELSEQADTQVRANGQLEAQLAVLRAQAKDLPKKQAEIAAVGTKLPPSAGQPALLRALAGAAETAGVQLLSVAPGVVAPVTAAAAPVVAVESAADPAAATVPTTPATATTAASGTAGTLLAMPLAIQVAGGYFEVEAYLALLEDLPRALRVSGLTITPGTDALKAPSSSASAATSTATASAADGRYLVVDVSGTAYVASGAVAEPAVPIVPAVPATAPAEESG